MHMLTMLVGELTISLQQKIYETKILSSKIIKEPRFSDHAILEATYDLEF